MNINTFFNAPVSSLLAYLTKQNVTAHNIANVNTEDFKSSETRMNEDRNGGVFVTISKNSPSGVDLPKEMTDMMATSDMVQANLKVLKTADEIARSVIDLKA